MQFVILLLLVGCKEKVQRQVSYYKSGALQYEAELVNGKREGVSVDYFENGKVRGRAFWKNGLMDGQKVIYYSNGNILEACNYNRGVCIYAKDFSEDGFLRQVTLYDSLGRVRDYFSYKKDGSRDFDRDKKDPIFIPQQDTVVLGEYYSPLIRLGNRQFPIVEVIIGDISDEMIIKNNKPLPKFDSLTSILMIKTDSLGIRKISGVVFERTASLDSFDIIPFTHRYFVKAKE